ncbi:MAG: DNA primase [Victivallaceae bacterium]
MNRAIPEEIVNEIRSRCDITDVIRAYIPIKKAGGGSWKALCPFHQEKTPSFTITEQHQRYHCFGCGKGGDIFSFIMEWERVDFPNAIHLLAAKCGVIIPEGNYSNPEEKKLAKVRANRRERLYSLNETFAKWYAELLKSQPETPVAQYLAFRNIPADIAERFQLGAAPDSWDASLQHGKKLGFSEDELLESGIILANAETNKIYDRFRNRLVFPIWNEQGRVVGFSARTIEANPQGAKYVNSPETPVFKKGNILYALPLARQEMQAKKSAIICEGQLDVIAMHRAGFTNAVAPQGTAFTDEQARILKRYTDCLFLAFDSDSAGVKATLRAFEITLPLNFELKIIKFPAGEDPDGIFKKSGKEGLAEVVNSAMDFLDFLGQVVLEKHDLNTPFGKSRAIAELIQYVRKISKPIVRELYVQRISALLSVRPETVFAELNKLNSEEKNKFNNYRPPAAPETSQPENNVTPRQNNLPQNLIHAEETLLKLALNQEEIATRLSAELPPESITDTPVGKALNELINLSLNGEWSSARIHLSELERNSQNAKLSMILSSEDKFPGDKTEKAFLECIASIRLHYLTNQKNEVMAQLRMAQTTEEKQELMKQLQALSTPTPRQN